MEEGSGVKTTLRPRKALCHGGWHALPTLMALLVLPFLPSIWAKSTNSATSLRFSCQIMSTYTCTQRHRHSERMRESIRKHGGVKFMRSTITNDQSPKRPHTNLQPCSSPHHSPLLRAKRRGGGNGGGRESAVKQHHTVCLQASATDLEDRLEVRASGRGVNLLQHLRIRQLQLQRVLRRANRLLKHISGDE